MSASIDEKISNLQSAVASLTSSIATLTAEVGHLSGKSFQPQTMKTSIPLLPMQQSTPRSYNRSSESGRRPYRDMRNQQNALPVRPQADTQQTIALSDILSADEDVIFYVNTGNDSNGNMTQANAVANFNGTDLIVSTCDLVPSLVGLKSHKP